MSVLRMFAQGKRGRSLDYLEFKIHWICEFATSGARDKLPQINQDFEVNIIAVKEQRLLHFDCHI